MSESAISIQGRQTAMTLWAQARPKQALHVTNNSRMALPFMWGSLRLAPIKFESWSECIKNPAEEREARLARRRKEGTGTEPRNM